jgi:hypothetical protein
MHKILYLRIQTAAIYSGVKLISDKVQLHILSQKLPHIVTRRLPLLSSCNNYCNRLHDVEERLGSSVRYESNCLLVTLC